MKTDSHPKFVKSEILKKFLVAEMEGNSLLCDEKEAEEKRQKVGCCDETC